ncbi:hypothetical protein V2J09_009269 [Rumex salicifolius]
MEPISSLHQFAVIFGLLGNVVSFFVYLSPSPTFYGIYKAKSTQGFESLPYAVALFSSMLTCYYGLIKHSDGTLLITINSVGIAVESFYLLIFLIYAPKQAKLKTTRLLLSFNVGVLGIIILLTSLLTHGERKEKLIGCICAVCSVCFFASPLCVIRTVIKTKSVEFMPFWLSFSLTVSAIMWFFYGFLIHDFYVALPNVLGLAFGITQMILYFIYKAPTKNKEVDVAKEKENEKELEADEEDNDDKGHVIKVSELVIIEVKPEGNKVDDEEDENSHVSSRVSVVGLLEMPHTECHAV